MIILDHQIYKKNFRKSAEEYYKNLEKVNIVFSSFEKFYKFISKEDFNTFVWWNDKKTQKARNSFCNKFCKKTKHPFNAISAII